MQLRIELYGEKYGKRYGYAVLTAVLKNQNPIKIRQTIRLCRTDSHIKSPKSHKNGAVSKQNEIAPNYFKRKRVPKGPFIVRIIV